MKRIIIFVLLFAALKVAGQTTGYLRFDTVKIMKQNGTCELYLINKTKDSLGILTNVGGGLTQFRKSKMFNDSTIIIGLDTLIIRGAAGGASGPAGGDLTGTYPNPTIANNAVTNTKLAQAAALTVKGNPANSTANVQDIAAASDKQVFRRSGTALGFGDIDLASSSVVGSSILPVANGGTGTATPSLIAGTNISITGTWPNQTINSTGGSGTPAGADREIQINNSGAFGAVTGVKITTNKTIYGDSLNTFRINIRGDSTNGNKIVFYPSKTKPGSITAYIGYNEPNNEHDADTTVNNILEGKIGSLDGSGTYIRWGMEKRWMPFPGAGYYQMESHPIEYRTVSGDVYRPISWTGKETGDDGTTTYRANLHSIYNWNGQKALGGFSLSTAEMINYHNYSGSGNISLLVKDSTDVTGNQTVAGTNIMGQIASGIRINTTTHYGRDILVNWESGPFFKTGKSSNGSLGFSYIFSINDTNANHMFAYGKDFPNRIDLWGHNDGRIVAGNANNFFPSYKLQAHSGENSFISGDYDANNTTVLYSGTFGHALTGGAGASGMGAGVNFKADDASNTFTTIGDIAGVWNGTPTAGAANGNLILRTRRAGTMTPSATSYSTGEFSIETIDSTATPANMVYQDPLTKKLKKAAAPGGIASINSQTGPAITFTGGIGTYTSAPSANTIAYNVDPTSDIFTRTIDAIMTTASNTGTSETDLYTKTVAGGTLNADKQTLNFEADGEFNDNTATAQLRLYFGGNVTLNTGAINISTAPTAWRLRGYIIRTSTTTAHVTYELQAPGLATPLFIGYSNLTSLDFTTTNILKVTAQAGGAGGGSSDITAHSWQITYKPQP